MTVNTIGLEAWEIMFNTDFFMFIAGFAFGIIVMLIALDYINFFDKKH